MYQGSLEKTQEKISSGARNIIDLYLSLPIGARPSCPYFNNRRRKSRGGLRVTKGKGTPEEIAEEAEIFAKLSRTDISSLSTDKLKAFLVSHDLGIDCSGFAYHVLNALCHEKTGKNISSFVRPLRIGLFKFIARLRPAENIGVSAFRDDTNSKAVQLENVTPGDVITFIGTGKDKLYNHILVVTGVEKTSDSIRISYAHSYAWPSDGLENHGVREGDILVHGNNLLSGTWKEKGEVGNANYTYESAKNAKEVSIRRLNFLS